MEISKETIVYLVIALILALILLAITPVVLSGLRVGG